jgi:hypothetical protein
MAHLNERGRRAHTASSATFFGVSLSRMSASLGAAMLLALGGCSNSASDTGGAASTAAAAGANAVDAGSGPSGSHNPFQFLLHQNRQVVFGGNGARIALSSDAGQFVNVKGVQAPASAPAAYSYFEGFYSYQITGITPGATINVALAVPEGLSPTGYVDCDAALAKCTSDSSAKIIGNTVFLALTDGGPGDLDGKANGVIAAATGAPVVASTSAPYLLPYSAFSQTTGGKNGVFVVPSNALSSAPQYLTTSQTQYAATASRFLTDATGQVTAQVPYGLVYMTSGASGGDHLYKADLTATGTTPVPAQLTNFAPRGQVCGFLSPAVDQTNLGDPATAYFILAETSGNIGSICGSPDNQFVLFHYTDSASTAPVSTPLGQGNASIVTFHDASTGKLDGVVLVDAAGNLKYYADIGFASGKTLLSGVNGFVIINASGQYAFLAVYKASAGTATTAPAITSAALYRVDSTGAISPALYTYQQPLACSFQGFNLSTTNGVTTNVAYSPYCASTGLPTPDGKSLFFTDNTATYATASPYAPASYSDKLLKAALDGSAMAQTVDTFTGGAPLYPEHARQPVTVQMNGFIGPTLLFTVQAYGSRGSGYPGYLYTLDQAGSSAAAIKQIANLPSGYFGAGYVAQGMTWVNRHAFDTGSGAITSLGAQVLKPDGTVVRTYPNSEFFSVNTGVSGTPANAVYSTAGLVLMSGFSPFPTGSLEYGGTTLKNVSLSNLGLTTLRGLDGKPYSAPFGDYPNLGAYTDPVGGFNLSDYYDDAMAADFGNNLVVQLTTEGLTSTDYQPLY